MMSTDKPNLRTRVVIALRHPFREPGRLLNHRYLTGTAPLSHGHTGARRAEQEVMSIARSRGNRVLAKGAWLLERMRRHRQRLSARLHEFDLRIAQFPQQPIRAPHGGLVPLVAGVHRALELGRRVEDGERAGSRRHQRVTSRQRWTAELLPVLDFAIFCWFLVGVLNVDPKAPGFLLLVAVALAVLGTLAVATWTRTVGEHLRRYKDEHGNLDWSRVPVLSRSMVYLSAAMAFLLGGLMYVRVGDEVYQATGTRGFTSVVVAVVMAAAAVLLNAYILYVVFSDGSDVTAELDDLRGQLRHSVRRRQQDVRRAYALRLKLEGARATEANVAAQVLQAAYRPLERAERAVIGARAVEPGPALELADRTGHDRPAAILADLADLTPDEFALHLTEAAKPAVPAAYLSWVPSLAMADASPWPTDDPDDEAPGSPRLHAA